MSIEEIRTRTQGVWDQFYSWSAIWRRSSCVRSMKGRLAFVLISKLYRQMYANTGIATDSARVARSARIARTLAKSARRLFAGSPMPDLQMPASAMPSDVRPASGPAASGLRLPVIAAPPAEVGRLDQIM